MFFVPQAFQTMNHLLISSEISKKKKAHEILSVRHCSIIKYV